jgi:predicted MFS family arabinose efflux permease
MTPIFVVAYLLVDERVDSSRHAEANAWLGSGYKLGSASGAALGGQLLAFTGPRIVAVALAGVAALATVLAQRLPHKPADSETSPAGDSEKAPSKPGDFSSDATQTA